MSLPSEVCTYLYDLARKKNGENFKTQFNNADVIIIQRFEDADHILRKNANNYRKNMAWLRQTLGSSRFSEDGKSWEARRDISQKYFNKYDREHAFGLAAHYAKRAVEKLIISGKNSSRVDDVILRRMTASVLINNFFDIELDNTDIDLDVIAELMELGSSYSFIPPGKTNHLYREMIGVFPDIRRRVIQSLSHFRYSKTEKSPLLKDLLEADSRSEGRVVLEQELISFIAAGTEASAATMGWVCYLLARHQSVQKELRELAMQFWSGDDLSWRRLSSIAPFHQFISEALRLYPTSPIVSRFAIEDDQLSDFFIPADQNVIVSFIGVQHDRRFRADPWKLDLTPDHTNKTNGDKVAFSFGPRVCGGKQFALLEMITMLSVFVMNAHFELTSNEAPEFKWKTQLVAEGGQPVRLRELSGS